MNHRRASLLVAAALAATVPASADFTSDTAPPWRGAPDTEFAGWESFVDPFLGDNPPDHPGSTSGAVLVQTAPGGTLTGSGNLYNPAQAPRFELRDAVECDLLEVWVQTSTWGVVLDPTSVELEYLGCDGSPVLAPAPQITVLAEYPNPMGLGTSQELLLEWDLSAVATPVLEYVVRFEAVAAHLALDSLLLDVRTDCGSAQDCDLGVAYCFGDGSGTPCPCLNEGAPGHGCGNGSSAGGARLFAEGSRSIAAGDLVLRASDAIPGQPGLFFQGESAVNGAQGLPFGDGLRCAGGGVVRLQTAIPDGSGAATSTVDVGAEGGVAPGDVRRYQFWYRDPQGGPCGTNFNLTNGFELEWLP